MALTLPLPEARDHLEALVARAQHNHERIVLTEHGEPTAVLISVAELHELQHAQDRADIALCEAIKARVSLVCPMTSSWPTSKPRNPASPRMNRSAEA